MENTNTAVLNEHMLKAGKYLTFVLGHEIYGLEILKVQEIIGMMHVTRVPKTSSYVRGVINLRGKVIPVIDLRLKFELEPRVDTERTCIIVVKIDLKQIEMIMGIIVDEVSEVLDIQTSQLEETPSFSSNMNTDYLLGIGKVAEKVILLLDIDKVLSSADEIELIKIADKKEAIN
ncbi:MAG: purine-binding chemotaxis protein CheW [Nitrospirae bacterium]|nr:purine-binding chemotaxis protein CheW [Nitrospirota bacterium]MBF0541925.1 purine-binding chemotaxis protein CheW [Nitrospirota bacterium]